MDDKPSELFNAYYYAHDCGEPYLRNDVWLSRFDVFAKRICLDIQPATVLDAGCALGLLVEVLRNRGVEAWGIDISEYAIQNIHPDIRDYCQVGSITKPFPLACYDLIVSIEVLEHLPKEEADKAIANLCQHSDDILFSSTPYDHQEATHFNVQPTEYWVECFARYGFFRDVDYDASYITPWAIRFRRQKISLPRLARNYERALMPLLSGNTVLRQQMINNRDQLDKNESQIAELEQDKHQLVQQISEIQIMLEHSEVHRAELEHTKTELEHTKAELERTTNELRDQLSATQSHIVALTQKIQQQELELAQAHQQQKAADELARTQQEAQEAADKRILQLQQEKQDLALQLLQVQSHLDSIQQRRLYKIYKALRHPFK